MRTWPTSSSSRTPGAAWSASAAATPASTTSRRTCSASGWRTLSEERRPMIRTTKLFAAAALGIVLGASACHNDELFRPANFVPIDPLFERYVSMGNSITAGFQSAGINDSTQLQAYPVLLANAMGSPRVTPLGYPTSTATSCYLRQARSVPQPYVSNTAVPGAEVLDIYNNLDTASNPNALTTLMLGGLTQTQMEARAHPTFVTVWIGNNDVLGAATNSANAGDSTLITPVPTFQANYGAMLDSIADA